jgi:hypothetical protein
MGAVGNQATYIRQLNRVMKSLRDDLTLEGLNQGIEASSLPDHLKGMAKMRLELASEYIDDSVRLKESVGNINALRARSPLLAPVPVTPAPSHARWSHAGAVGTATTTSSEPQVPCPLPRFQ